MEKQVKEENYEEAKKNLDRLKALEDKSKKLKVDSKRFPIYKAYEESLNDWKQKLVKQTDAGLVPVVKPVVPASLKDSTIEPEVSNKTPEVTPVYETIEQKHSGKTAEEITTIEVSVDEERK